MSRYPYQMQAVTFFAILSVHFIPASESLMIQLKATLLHQSINSWSKFRAMDFCGTTRPRLVPIKKGSEYLFNDLRTTAHAEHPEGTSFSLPRYDSPLMSPMLIAEDEM
ncbi:hypothetical protein SNOG_09275 [Parastagonospora nodorum SN15]|uniref:Uncharacterized protein n=1 Tax=Phaeosphaeria nodorum (strain SN15 / ATCC MYA-4574 / FGSC 10173) TaxID=321614 RepID=Q0UG39_PHANO|nr:hypothetical protein SNOG_09275 [Parastagonospora nodorum SN15]EAT83467.1 hypothetical protein SNOG_09275 [Parastagonospora nodorum SN15]